MPIPECNENGVLPLGIYDCTLNEIGGRFGKFQNTDHRYQLFQKLLKFLEEVRSTHLINEVIIDGSFVSDKSIPNDIDLILVLPSDFDSRAAMRPFDYNFLSKRHARKQFGFDVLVAQKGSQAYQENVLYFQKVRNRPELQKGVLRIHL